MKTRAAYARSETAGRGVFGECGGCSGRVQNFPAIVPALSVGTPHRTLRVRLLKGTRSVPGCIPTQSVGTIIMWGFPWPLREQARSHILPCVHRTIVGASLLAKAVCQAMQIQLAVANNNSATERLCPRCLPCSYSEPAISSARIGSTDSSVSLRPWLAWQKPCI